MPSTDGPLRIAIVNDYELVVLGVARMLTEFRDRVEIVECDVGSGAYEDVDIVLFDTFAHVADGRPGVRNLVEHHGPKVVIYTWRADQRLIRTALDQGAAGVLSKALSSSDLVDALERIHGGDVITCAGEEPAGADHPGDWPGRDFDLSSREAEVLALVARGLSNQEIATTLFVSVNSVKTYIRGAYRKIGVGQRPQAVLWALDHGFGVEPRTSPPPQR
jgi:DNA-binding NarL/FixJ family response regulator